jgi:hypothetical protein
MFRVQCFVRVVQIAEPILVRPHLLTPEHATVEIGEMVGFSPGPGGEGVRLEVDRAALDDPGAWIRSSHTVDADGQRIDAITEGEISCELPKPPGNGTVRQASRDGGISRCIEEIRELGYRQAFTYFPADRFWAFQWIETGLFLALSAALAGACFWTLRRRLT